MKSLNALLISSLLSYVCIIDKCDILALLLSFSYTIWKHLIAAFFPLERKTDTVGSDEIFWQAIMHYILHIIIESELWSLYVNKIG